MDLARCDFETGTEVARDASQTESFGLGQAAPVRTGFRAEERRRVAGIHGSIRYYKTRGGNSNKES